MDGHQPDAVAALFENRRLGRFARRRGPQFVDEPAERDAAAGFVLARQLRDVQYVGERLLAGRAKNEADVRPRLGEQPADRVGDRPVVARLVQPLQQAQGVGDWRQLRRRLGGQREILSRIAAQLSRNPERMERAEAMPELQQRLVVDREQRALQCREHRQFVVRPLDRRERCATGLDLLAPVKRLAADQQVRDAARFDRVDVGAGHVLAEADEAAEQYRDVAGLERHANLAAVRLFFRHGPAALFREPGDVGADRVRERSVDRLGRCLERAKAAAPVRLGHRQRHDRRLLVMSLARGRQRHVCRLARVQVAGHLRRKGRVHELLNRRHAAIARGQLQHASAARRELPADVPIRADVGAAEPIDRLLRIADDEELAADVVGEEQQNLRLNRIGVLEFVDEDMRELLLEVRAHVGVAPDQVAGAGQQVGEIEHAGRPLEILIAFGRARELLLQASGQVGVGVLAELLEIVEEGVARGEHVRSTDVLAELVAAALAGSRKSPIAREVDEPRLPAVEIAAAERLFKLDLAAEPTPCVGVDMQVVARRQG